MTIALFICARHRGEFPGRGPAADEHRHCDDVAVGRGRLSVGVAEERKVARLDQLHRRAFPASSRGRTSTVPARAFSSPYRRQPLTDPLRGPFVRGRRRQPRTDVDGQRVEYRANLRVFEAFGANSRKGVALRRRLRQEGRRNQKQRKECPSSWAELSLETHQGSASGAAASIHRKTNARCRRFCIGHLLCYSTPLTSCRSSGRGPDR